ncbi:hypothetical protein [Clostridium sp. D33t1_170424_F3]|uniref:hypothetical protein n=1 Tax=Clostridium sp. D33t1_170424_F3 TaxID=2787099 RepID=UPI00232A8374|nr:hypothetical protein [Clostridium sp. D33t1_170424_F3]MDC0700680.1 hypothetical protein [Blautia wexlerae]
MSDKKKMGRPPSENPKCVKLTVRVHANEARILDEYCLRKGLTRAEGVREAITDLEQKK